MNGITMYVEEYRDERTLVKDAIEFRDSLFVKILIDGEDVESQKGFGDAVIYYDELARSINGSGRYLIFTCACGIAEDGGWGGVDVTYENGLVTWEFEVGERVYVYTFDERDYISEIESLAPIIESTELTLEPNKVVFPEGFSRNVQ